MTLGLANFRLVNKNPGRLFLYDQTDAARLFVIFGLGFKAKKHGA